MSRRGGYTLPKLRFIQQCKRFHRRGQKGIKNPAINGDVSDLGKILQRMGQLTQRKKNKLSHSRRMSKTVELNGIKFLLSENCSSGGSARSVKTRQVAALTFKIYKLKKLVTSGVLKLVKWRQLQWCQNWLRSRLNIL